MSQSSLRPPLVFRVGVTGHRDIAEDDARIGAAVEDCLKLVRDEIARIHATPAAREAYALGLPFALRIVSPLAVGADRLVARVGLAQGAELYSPLPFPRQDYVEDFRDKAVDFDRLADQARLFELDGAHVGSGAQTESYNAVGQFVARNCDLLIAIWDGARAHGQGGSGDIVSFAARAGVRIWWVHAAKDLPPRLIRHSGDYQALSYAPAAVPAGDAAARALRDYLTTELTPPRASPSEREGVLGRLAELWRRQREPDRSPLIEFFDEQPLPRLPYWRTYAWFMALVNGETDDGAEPEPGAAAVPEGSPAAPWDALLRAADRASRDYGDRYRSSYVLAALFAVVALGSAAFGGSPEFGWQSLFVAFEIASLLAISGLVFVNDAWRWHERWIAYRLVAEIARKQKVLAIIGQSLPGADVHLLAPHPDESSDVVAPPRDAWIAWIFLAYRRAAPPPTGSMTDAKRAALTAGQGLIAEQIEYHETRRRRSKRAGGVVRILSEGFFFATLIVAFVKLWLVAASDNHAIQWIVFAAAIVSSVATAFVGIRAYAEFALLVRQSEHMLDVLRAGRRELDGLTVGVAAPQASFQLGRLLYATTTAMMQDITGWAHLFRVKALETL